MMMRIAIATAAVLVTLVLAGPLGATSLLRPGQPASQVPPAEARAIAVEQQLLCPQCTNKRLDTCEIEICQDMRRDIRARLDRGESEQDILRFFAGRYGDRILAALPTSGFPLWLWGWTLLSVLAVSISGLAWLRRQRRPAAEAPALGDAEERWLSQLADPSNAREG